MGDIVVRPVEQSDAPVLVPMMARAFADDPCFSWVFGDERRRYGDLLLVFGMAFAALAPHQLGWSADGGAAVSLWAPPGEGYDPGVVAPYVEQLTRRCDEATMARLWSFFSATQDHHPSEPHFYLGVLAADAGRQGRGLGSSCLRAGLAVVDAAHGAAYLESSNEKNVPLYERHGFEVVDRIDLDEGGPPVFFMWRGASDA